MPHGNKMSHSLNKRKLRALWAMAAGGVLVVIVLFISPSLPISTSTDDVQIIGLEYGHDPPFSDSTSSVVNFDYKQMQGVKVEAMLEYSAMKDGLYYRVFGENGEFIGSLDFDSPLQKGTNKIPLGYHLDDISTIYSLKLCWTTKPDYKRGGRWGADSPDVFCTFKTFDPPRFNIEITPQTVQFDLYPLSPYDVDSQERIITIRNNGDFAIRVIPRIDDPQFENPDSPSVSVSPEIQSEFLVPTESTQFTIKSGSFGGKRDVQVIGYITDDSNKVFKIPFTINVNVH